MDKRCIPADFGFARDTQMHYYYVAPSGITMEELEHPEYWGTIARKGVHTGAIISVMTEDTNLFARFLVRAVSRQGLSLGVLECHDFNKTSIITPDVTYRVENRGVKQKWAIVRSSDNKTVKAGYDTEADALVGLDEYERATA